MSKFVRLGAVAALAAAIVACAPMFAEGSTLSATALGPLVRISWTAATPIDSGDTIASYRIAVDGTEVATRPGNSTACVLTGLAANTTYEITVTAVDDDGEWSGSYGGGLTERGRLSLDVTTPSAGGGGVVRTCVATTDTDGDRLPDAVETNTGTYVSAANTGSSPTDNDTDDDGLRDGDEVLGTTGGLNLPAMGARPTKRNIVLEYDWFDDANECASHSHRPTAAAINRFATAFASSPVTNPDGTTGITTINDYGQGGAFTGGNLVADADGVIAGGVNGADFAAIKSANFAANRNGYVHYVLLPHRYNTNSTSSGQAEYPGDDLVVSLYCAGGTNNVANTIAHELGHNLNLGHGGNNSVNYKPNYNSVMNYQFQFPGVDTNCTRNGDGVLDFSRGTRANLVESALSETAGICNGVDIDWNLNGSIDGGTISFDINGDSAVGTLTDWNDWGNLYYLGLTDGDGASPTNDHPHTEIVTEQPVPGWE